MQREATEVVFWFRIELVLNWSQTWIITFLLGALFSAHEVSSVSSCISNLIMKNGWNVLSVFSAALCGTLKRRMFTGVEGPHRSPELPHLSDPSFLFLCSERELYISIQTNTFFFTVNLPLEIILVDDLVAPVILTLRSSSTHHNLEVCFVSGKSSRALIASISTPRCTL